MKLPWSDSKNTGFGFARTDAICRGKLNESDGLNSGNFEALAAADIFAADKVVATDHVALGFGEASTVAIVGPAGKLVFFTTDHPADLVLGLLTAVRAGHRVSALFGTLIEKITLFHPAPRWSAAMLGAAFHAVRRLPDCAKKSIA